MVLLIWQLLLEISIHMCYQVLASSSLGEVKMASKIYMLGSPLTMKEKKKTVNLYVILPGCLTSPFWDTTISSPRVFSKWNSPFWYSTQSFQLSKGAKHTKVNSLHCTFFHRQCYSDCGIPSKWTLSHSSPLIGQHNQQHANAIYYPVTNYPLFAKYFLYSVFVIWHSIICVFNTKWDIRVHFCDLLVRLFL